MLVCSICVSCTFHAQTAKYQPYAKKCDMATEKKVLNTKRIECNDDITCGYLLGSTAAVGVIVFIVAGTIVATNNAIHWAEYQTTCPNDKKPKSSNLLPV